MQQDFLQPEKEGTNLDKVSVSSPPIKTRVILFVWLGFIFVLGGRVLCSQGLLSICYTAEGDLELLIIQLLPLKCWDHGHTLLMFTLKGASPCLDYHLARVTKWRFGYLFVC